jgi:hypothetical protein
MLAMCSNVAVELMARGLGAEARPTLRQQGPLRLKGHSLAPY